MVINVMYFQQTLKREHFITIFTAKLVSLDTSSTRLLEWGSNLNGSLSDSELWLLVGPYKYHYSCCCVESMNLTMPLLDLIHVELNIT